jgi:hypothetical protein
MLLKEVSTLLEELDGPPGSDVEQAWLAEAQRRSQELDSGVTEPIPMGGCRRAAYDRVLAIGNRVSDLPRRARAEHRPPGDVADEVARDLIGRGPRRAINAVTRAFA